MKGVYIMDKSKYVVLDVETNGLSSLKHDLLSISIYKPDWICVNFLDTFFRTILFDRI